MARATLRSEEGPMTSLVLGFVLVSALMNALWNVYAKDSESPIAYLALVHWVTVAAGLPLLFFVDLGEVPREVWYSLAAAGVIHTVYMTALSLAYERAEMMFHKKDLLRTEEQLGRRIGFIRTDYVR